VRQQTLGTFFTSEQTTEEARRGERDAVRDHAQKSICSEGQTTGALLVLADEYRHSLCCPR
jgi:hypothetical protein